MLISDFIPSLYLLLKNVVVVFIFHRVFASTLYFPLISINIFNITEQLIIIVIFLLFIPCLIPIPLI